MRFYQEVLSNWFATRPRKSRFNYQRRIAAEVQELELRTLLTIAAPEFVDPNAHAGNAFGQTVTVLTNGNVVITAPNDAAGGGNSATQYNGAGAVYLYDGRNGALLDTLTGSSSGDQIGAYGVTALPNGNFVIDSPHWNGEAGAVTWGSGITGVPGATITAANSLIGHAGDRVGSSANFESVTVLSNGNYVVDSEGWNGYFGAVTWGSGTTGVNGFVSAANSLVGSAAGDDVGIGPITALSNGNYTVDSYMWNNSHGAVTWGNGTTGITGVVSAANSLVGSLDNDNVGQGNVTALSTGNYVVDSPSWGYGSPGAVTFGNGTTGITGIISAANSLVGTAASDQVGGGYISALSNGNYVVDSYKWNSGRGAVTWGNGVSGISGNITAANSLVGTTGNDLVGSGGVTALVNGNYVADSYMWNNSTGTTGAAVGAVTWGSGITGVAGLVSAANSLIGSQANDQVGFGGPGVTALRNGNYVVPSRYWNNSLGAVTLGSGTSGITGFVDSSNSLTGSYPNDQIGSDGVTALQNGNYVVKSPLWQSNTGAATFGSGVTGVTGTVSSSNSLVGSTSGDRVGNNGVTALSNGNYVVQSAPWNTNLGAATFGDGTIGVSGLIDSTNSLVGDNHGDDIGLGVVTALNNGNYAVASWAWNSQLGAVTFGNGTTGVAGPVSLANSVVGLSSFVAYSSFPSVAEDKTHSRFYAVFSNDGSGHVYRGSTATGFANHTTNGPSMDVSNYTTGVANLTGSVSFGTIVLDPSVPQTYATQSITVTNNGDAPLTVQPATVTSGFSITNNFTANQKILPGSSASFTVQLNATAVGSPSGTVTIPNDGPTASRSFKFNVTGTVAAPQIDVQPGATTPAISGGAVGPASALVGAAAATTVSPGDMGGTIVGKPLKKVFTVFNNGQARLFVTSVTVPTGYSVIADHVTNQAIPSRSSATFTLQLDAAGTGVFSGTVLIANNVRTTPFTFNVTGNVTAPKILVQQASTTLSNHVSMVNLGSTPAGTPIRQKITITNTGTAPLIVQPVRVPTGFSIYGANFTVNQSIAVGGTASFMLQLTATRSGNSTGIVTIANSDTTASPFTFNVSGIVTPAGSTLAPVMVVKRGATILVNGNAPDFFPVGVRAAHEITVWNYGNTDLVVQPIAPPTGFTIVRNFAVNQRITAGHSASFLVQLNAVVTGTPHGTVTIRGNDPNSASFALSVYADHAPTAISLNNVAVSLNPSGATYVGLLKTTDLDSAVVAQNFTYRIGSTLLSSVPTSPSFSIDGAGNLYFAPSTRPAIVGVYDISITSTDFGGQSVNPAPIKEIYVSGPSVSGVASQLNTKLFSGTPRATTLVTFLNSLNQFQNVDDQATLSRQQTAAFASPAAAGADLDLTSNFTYQLATSGDYRDFTIDTNGNLQTAVTVQATTVQKIEHISIISTNTLTGISAFYPFTITILPVPANSVTVASASLNLPESSANGFIVGAVSATDVGGRALTYAITGGNTNGAFAINSTTGQITVANSSALDLSTNPTFALTVTASDNGISGSATITIKMTGVALSNSIVGSDSALGGIIGQFSTVAPQTGNTYQYSLIAGLDDGASFSIDASGNLKLNVGLNATLKNSNLIDVVSTDQNGFAITKAFTITVPGGGVPAQFFDPHLEVANQFGATITPLVNGNLVITAPNDDFGGVGVGSAAAGTGAGVVYLFNGVTGTLISTIKGSHPGDHIGSGGVTALSNGNFVIDSPNWNGNRGAVTWGSGTVGVSGIVGTTNSLVGSTVGDAVGQGGIAGQGGITALPTGNYVVDSSAWNHGAAKVGAVTFGDGSAGIAGSVSSLNSLVGTLANDQVGLGGIKVVGNGNYVIDSSSWSNGSIAGVGAVTWGSGTTGVTGTITAVNSLIGSTKADAVGLGGVTVLTNGNYVVDSSTWNHGAVKVGAVTFGNAATGVSGIVSAVNSLVGTLANDQVGQGGVTALTNGNYVVDSYSWNSAAIAAVGAVTWASGVTGIRGTINATNSLVGTRLNDQLGRIDQPNVPAVTPLSNGNYVVASQYLANGTVNQAGAATFGDGSIGIHGNVSVANSLVGSQIYDRIGAGGVTALTNGNYVVVSQLWNNGSVAKAGAVTFGNGTSGLKGTVSPANSLVGTTVQDGVGLGGITPLTNGSYVVTSQIWHNHAIANAGAVTWGGISGINGPVSSTNSLVGSSANDSVGFGGITSLVNGNYVVDSYKWNGPGATAAGAVTWGSGTAGVMGVINSSNSLVGVQASDSVGLAGVTALSNGNYVVNSNYWNNKIAGVEVIHAGAVTWGNGTLGTRGSVSPANSLVGTLTGEFVGFGGSNVSAITALDNGNYLVSSIDVNRAGVTQAGAVTFGNGRTGVFGQINAQNSVLGQFASPAHSSTFVGVTADEAHGAAYIAFRPSASSDIVYGLSTATGFLALSTNGSPVPLIQVSDSIGPVTSESFGTSTVGTPVTQKITITNNGSATLAVHSITVPTGYSIIGYSGSAFNIGIGQSVRFNLQLNATIAGTFNGIVTIASNASGAIAFKFNVTGTVTAPRAVVQQGATTLTSGPSTNGLSTVSPGSTPARTLVAVPAVVTVNHAPSTVSLAFTGSTGSVLTMNQTSAVVVGVLTTTDVDSSTMPQTFTYTVNSPTFLIGTVATPVFSVDSGGNLRLAAGAPVGTYNLSVTSKDQGGLSVTKILPPITVTGPGILSTAVAVNVASNVAAHSTIANLPVSVVAVQNALGNAASNSISPTHVFNRIRYQLALGGDDRFFTIDANGHLQTAVRLDATVKTDYRITIITTDATTGLSTSHIYAIKVVPLSLTQ